MVDLKSYMVGYDEKTVEQIETIASSPAYQESKIRIMPDAHAGKGSCVGFTATFKDRICPNTVGVDIACRVSLFDLTSANRQWDKRDLVHFDNVVNRAVPAGFSVRGKEHKLSLDFPYEDLRCWDELRNHAHLRKSLGTLGGGNHYIELDKDEMGNVWLSIHCGSRNLGKQVAEYYQAKAIAARDARLVKMRKDRSWDILDIAKEDREAFVKETQKITQKMWLADDLCYIEGQDLEDYLNDMKLCNEWSFRNHMAIYDAIAEEFGLPTTCDYITCIHNYVDVDNKLIRKGAISANAGEYGIVPLNMRDGLLIVQGRGNEDWNNSLPHGAGRILSRGAAKKELDLLEFENTMEGIYSTSIGFSTLDEAPMAYKPADEIIAAIGDNARIVGHLMPIYNFKAH